MQRGCFRWSRTKLKRYEICCDHCCWQNCIREVSEPTWQYVFSIFIIDDSDVHRSTRVNPCLDSTVHRARSPYEHLWWSCSTFTKRCCFLRNQRVCGRSQLMAGRRPRLPGRALVCRAFTRVQRGAVWGLWLHGKGYILDSTRTYHKNFWPWPCTSVRDNPVVTGVVLCFVFACFAFPTGKAKHRNNSARVASARRKVRSSEHKGSVQFNTPTFSKDLTA